MVDAVVSAVLSVALFIDLLSRGGPVWQLPLGLALTSTVAWRRWAPATAVVVGLAAATLVPDPSPLAQSAVFPIVVILDYYSLGRRSGGSLRRVVAVVLVVGALPSIWLTPGDSGLIDAGSVWLFFFIMPFLVGRTVTARAQANLELVREARQLEEDVEEQARRAIASERTRIARDLHDVVAHNVSVMAIQVVAARRVAATDPEGASSALRAVATCGREALVEMRRMVGVLHRSELEFDAAGAPGLAQIEVLVERAHLAGVDVDVHVHGQQHALAAGRDLVAFRVIQEALTNVIRHAPAARARVVVRFDSDVVVLVISNDASPVPTAGTDRHDGRGLVGMRERLALYGGTVRAGPRPGGGFEVTARLPALSLEAS